MSFHQRKTMPFFALALLGLGGCATMFNNGSQTFQVQPINGQSAKVRVRTPDALYQTTIPATITAAPSTFNQVSIEIIDDCYDAQTHHISKTVTPLYYANILNFYGFIIDALAGYMWKYESFTSVILSKKNTGCSDSSVQPQQNIVSTEGKPTSIATGNTEGQSVVHAPNQKVKEFIMISYKNLMEDLSKGTGSYLSSLLEMLKISKENQAAETKKIQALASVYSNIPEFAEQVTAYYSK